MESFFKQLDTRLKRYNVLALNNPIEINYKYVLNDDLHADRSPQLSRQPITSYIMQISKTIPLLMWTKASINRGISYILCVDSRSSSSAS